MPTGTVKWFNTDKGYGFILPNEGGNDVFLHVRDVEAAGLKHINEGQQITYEVLTDRKTGKSKAGNLKLA